MIDSILHSFGMLRDAAADKANTERRLVIRMWELLAGEKRGGVSFPSLRTVVCAILGLGPRPTCRTAGKTSFGRYIRDDFTVGGSEAVEWRSQFRPLCLNKTAAAAQRRPKKPAVPAVSEHKPRINPQSQRLAGHAREKWRKAAGEGPAQRAKPSLADLLSTVKRAQDQQSMMLRKKKEELQNCCTFKPRISRYNSHKQPLVEQGKNRVDSLRGYSRIRKKTASENDVTVGE